MGEERHDKGLASNIFSLCYCELQEGPKQRNGYWPLVPVVKVRYNADADKKYNTHMKFRIDLEILKSKGLCKAFFCGSNTTCHQHIHQHYPIYQQWCNEQGLQENYWAVPPHILKEREEVKKKSKQQKLDGVFKRK